MWHLTQTKANIQQPMWQQQECEPHCLRKTTGLNHSLTCRVIKWVPCGGAAFMHMYALPCHCLLSAASDLVQDDKEQLTGATDDAVKTSTCCCCYCLCKKKKKTRVRQCSCSNRGVILSEKSSTLLSSAKKNTQNTHKAETRGSSQCFLLPSACYKNKLF